ncbi:MAG: DNA translocase FtsK 4TM domain-containing protein, partial [Prevotella sp.]|nr:DNA translocase FtsK 4TM domain-containing protein [Prevotella sp.]
MAKKKQTKIGRKVSFKEAIGFNAVFANEKTNFTVGITLLVLAVLMIISFISYFTTCDADQSLVMHPLPGDFANTGREFHNACGSWGAYVSYFFIDVCFGFTAFLIPLMCIVWALHMMGVVKVN